MIDKAQAAMAAGTPIALELISGSNMNMSQSHFHEYYELFFLDSGTRYHTIDDKVFLTKAGDFILFPPLTMHHSFSNRDVCYSRVVIYFQPDVIASAQLREAFADPYHIFRPSKEVLRGLRRMVYEMLSEQEAPGPFHWEDMKSLLNLILIQVMRVSRIDKFSGGNRINEVISYIHENYASEITVPLLADRFGLSESYLCRQFRKYANRTIIEYLQGTRVMNAKRLFMETDMNVTQVAAQTGFSNLTHFNRVFRAVSGESPSEYRKKCREPHGSINKCYGSSNAAYYAMRGVSRTEAENGGIVTLSIDQLEDHE